MNQFYVLRTRSPSISSVHSSSARLAVVRPSLRRLIATQEYNLGPSWRRSENEVIQSSNKTDLYLARLPTIALIRSWFLAKVLRSPVLFNPGLACLRAVANSQTFLLDPDRNPILKAVLKPLVYDHFCAGTNCTEVLRTVDGIKSQGYTGVILSHAKEIHPREYSGSNAPFGPRVDEDIQRWRDRNLETMDLMTASDLLGLKVTGAGRSVTNALMHGNPLPLAFQRAMHDICSVARDKGCRLWIDAEQQAAQDGIDRLAVDLMRVYNRGRKPVVYNTLQAYLKDSKWKLQSQLKLAVDEGWTLALKLVRGAYISTDIRDRIHDTKAETDATYNGIVRDILHGTLPGRPMTAPGRPRIELFLAGHNHESIHAACQLAKNLSQTNSLHTEPEIAMLQGMADDIGSELVQHESNSTEDEKAHHALQSTWRPRVYRYLTWGTIRECMLYLVRRAVENRGATNVTLGPQVFSTELRRRIFNRARSQV